MAVILGNKYQSKNRDNFIKITGLSEANEKIKPENMPRIFGGIGEVYFNGQSAAGSSTGNGGGNTGQTDPNGGGGSGGSGGSGSGGSGSSECQCETLSDALIVNGIPCCVSGFNCEDGTPVSVQLDPNGGVPILPCEDPMPKPTPENPILKLMVGNCQNPQGSVIFTQMSGAGAAATAFSAAASEKHRQEKCPDENQYTEYTLIDKLSIIDIEYTRTCLHNAGRCSGCTSITLCEVITDESQITDEMRAFYSKKKKKQYFAKDGKFYDACDPYGTPPSDEPIIMCDENGNQYSVSPDGKIQAL